MLHKATKAREVLADCRYALTELRNDPTGPAWRVRWFGAIAMLRAVGHVLVNVDAKSTPQMRVANSEWWNDLKRTKPAIFSQFIDSDRHAILKEYDHRAAQNATVTIGGPTTYSYEMHGGPFDGQDPRDVVQQAIEWWEQQLAEIETGTGRS